jgi:nucleoredoxin
MRFASLALAAALAALPTAAQSAPPATLSLQDLVRRPDRWPATVQLARDFQFGGGQEARAGQAVQVVEFDGARVTVQTGELYFDLAPSECDLLEAANRAWAALTPDQRKVDAELLAKDASLWPRSVACSSGFVLDDGTEIAPGGEFDFLYFDRDGGVKVYSQPHQTVLVADLAQTDLVVRARALALIEPAKRPSRVAAALKGALVDAQGKTVEVASDAQVYVLYFGASWCGPCRKFSPGLVRFVSEAAAANPRLAVMLMSGDKEDSDMLEYMKEEKMPWPAMPLARLQQTPLFLSQSAGYIPHLVVLDRYGLVLASSVENGQYAGPERPFGELKKLVAAGRAK